MATVCRVAGHNLSFNADVAIITWFGVVPINEVVLVGCTLSFDVAGQLIVMLQNVT
jgi:hypothetical protein